MADPSFPGPMRLELANGAVLLIERPEQMEAIPPETTFEPVLVNVTDCGDRKMAQHAQDEAGRQVYRQLDPKKAAMAIVHALGEELKAAADALFRAAHVIKESGTSPLAASRAHEAAQRASQAHLEIVGQSRA